MPVIYKKRYRRRPATGALTDDQLAWLTDGWCLDGDPARLGQAPFTDLAAARSAWDLHRAQVVAVAREAAGARSRLIPSAWWRFDATEGLHQLSGPEPLEPVTLWRGLPKMWKSYEDAELARFESEAEYLARLDIDPGTLRRDG